MQMDKWGEEAHRCAWKRREGEQRGVMEKHTAPLGPERSGRGARGEAGGAPANRILRVC